jgi:branched-chain amino acid transport system ATP-binding protein
MSNGHSHPLLKAERLSRDFGGLRAVDAVSLEVGAGGITGLIGPNGAGKTTLFNLIAGSFPPTSGRLWLRGQRIDSLRPDRICALGLGRTFQIPRPFAQMTVLENVMLAPLGQSGERFWAAWLRPGVVAAEERRHREVARHWLDFLGLTGLASAPAKALSGGQRKLLELARVLAQEPSLILLDEPGAGVSPALLELIMAKIVELNRQGITFLIIEHNMDLVAALCGRVVVMAGGRLLTDGPPAAVRADPRVIDVYLGGIAA